MNELRNIVSITKEEYDEMNVDPEYTYEEFISDLKENLSPGFADKEITWLNKHGFDTSTLNHYEHYFDENSI